MSNHDEWTENFPWNFERKIFFDFLTTQKLIIVHIIDFLSDKVTKFNSTVSISFPRLDFWHTFRIFREFLISLEALKSAAHLPDFSEIHLAEYRTLFDFAQLTMNRKLKEINLFGIFPNFVDFSMLQNSKKVFYMRREHVSVLTSCSTKNVNIHWIKNQVLWTWILLLCRFVCFSEGVKNSRKFMVQKFSSWRRICEVLVEFSNLLPTHFWRFSILLWVKFYVVSFASTLHSEKYIFSIFPTLVHTENRIY